MKKVALLLIPFILIMIPLFPQASTGIENREDVFSFLKKAFKAQVALSEKERSAAEIKKVLDPYFTTEYQKVFWKENIHQEGRKFLSYGTDFAKYYVPYYQFSDQTKVVISPKKIYVYEYFPKRVVGPVSYQSHYEGLILERSSGNWKVAQYFYNQTQEILTEKSVIKRINVQN